VSIFVTSSLKNILQPTIIALGNFDGIHQGHQQVIRAIVTPNPSLADTYPTLVTFTPHPQEFFTGQKKQLLTPIPEKAEILENLGIKQLILLPFDRELASLTPTQFVKNILIQQIQVKFISVGEDFHFGQGRQGNAEQLKSLGNQYGVRVVITPEQSIKINYQSTRISSSYLRDALSQGNLQLVKAMLGRDYQIQGKVIPGQKLGRTIGFPTANLAIPPEKFLPRQGVYVVKVHQQKSNPTNLWGVMNIGNRPTVSGQNISVEVHWLDWQGNLYGEHLTVSLIHFLRPEQKFDSLNALKEQIQQDCQQAKELISRENH
jgi:riboflavin kinase/FMN adenylyltransferase